MANDVSNEDSGMESDENEVTIFFRNGENEKISRTSKKNIARELVKILANSREKRLTKKMWWLLNSCKWSHSQLFTDLRTLRIERGE